MGFYFIPLRILIRNSDVFLLPNVLLSEKLESNSWNKNLEQKLVPRLERRFEFQKVKLFYCCVGKCFSKARRKNSFNRESNQLIMPRSVQFISSCFDGVFSSAVLRGKIQKQVIKSFFVVFVVVKLKVQRCLDVLVFAAFGLLCSDFSD